MKLFIIVLSFVGLIQCQKKLIIVPDTSSVDILVQTSSKTIADFSSSVDHLQTSIDVTLKATEETKVKTQNIPLNANAKLNAAIGDITDTARDIEKLTGSSKAKCSEEASKSASSLQSSSIDSINRCVKKLTDLDNTISVIVAIKQDLANYRLNSSYDSLKACVPKTSTNFNFFDTIKIKKCLSTAVSNYKNFVTEKTSVINSINEYIKNLTSNGITVINSCLDTTSGSTNSSAENITNSLIKCADIIPQFLTNVSNTISNIQETLSNFLEGNLTRISTSTNDSLAVINSLNEDANNKLVAFKEYITDAIVNLAPYQTAKFVDTEAVKGNIFSVIEKQILERSSSVLEEQSKLRNEASNLLQEFNTISSQATQDKLDDCQYPAGKSSIVIVDCLIQISRSYSEGINKLSDLVNNLVERYNQNSDDVNSLISFIKNKIEKLSVTSEDTAEFLYDKSGISLNTLVKDKLETLLSPLKNVIMSQIEDKFQQLLEEYNKIDAYIAEVKNAVPASVQITGQPIREAIELLAIINPSVDYGFLYNKSLNVIGDAESKVYKVIDENLVQISNNLFTNFGSLSDNYSSRIQQFNTSGYECITANDTYFTCVASCLKTLAKDISEFFQISNEEANRLLAEAKNLTISADVTIKLATKDIVQVATNESIKQSGRVFRDSNMTIEEYFALVGKEIKKFNSSLSPQLMEIGDNILDNAAKVNDKQFATLHAARPLINAIVDKVNTAVDDVILIYPSAPINNKTIVALANAAFDKIYKTFTVVTSPASNLKEVANNLKQQVGEVFNSVSEQSLKTKCYDVYPLLEDAITCLSKTLNNMTAEINRLTETLYTVRDDSQNVRNDARETLNENRTAEIQKLQSESIDIANSYYLHYSVNYDVIYSKVIQSIRGALNPIQRSLQYNINFLNTAMIQLPQKEERARYEITRNLSSATTFLINAVNAVRYQSNPKLLGNQLELYNNLTDNYTRIIEPYIPKYKSDLDYYTDLFKNHTAQYNALIQLGSPENINASCSKSEPLYVYSPCVRKIGNTFVENLQNFYKLTQLTQTNTSNFLYGTDDALKNLLNGIVNTVSNYNLQLSKPIAEQLYHTGGFTVESIFRIGVNTNNRTFYSIYPSIQKLASDNKKIVDNISKINFNNVFPVQNKLEQYVNSITSAFKRAIVMSDGLTMENEGAKAQTYADELAKRYKNFTDSLVAKAIDLGNKTNVELAIAASFEDTATMKYVNNSCPVYGNPYPISDANVCSNDITWTNSVNTRNKLNLITGYNNELVALNNTAASSALEFGNKLSQEFAAYSQPIIQKLDQWARL